MTEDERKTKRELWKQIECLEQKFWFMEQFLEEKNLLIEDQKYVENAVRDAEDLPFD